MRRLGLPAERLPDEALMAGLTDGGPEVALAFVRRFQRKVYGVALAVVGDPTLAEDVAQQTFERAWRHAAVFDPRRGTVPAWLSRIAHNLAVDAVRTRKPTPVDPADLLAVLDPDGDTPERRSTRGETSAEVRTALRALPAEQARAVVMAGVYGLTAVEVANAEGIPLGTAKTRIRLAMAKLRHALVPAEHDKDADRD
jgi:RNA polymerase sigma-70 factor (ECF subfamily)